ncbi:MAG: hypothetical protein KGL39_25955 [Patescibacteria group bacterium]|nr:hypothetical protein [Patescibacteria group bacterium]
MPTEIPGVLTAAKLVRCLWCRERIGEARYRLKGRWQTKGFENSLAIWLAGEEVSDGICPECLAEQKRRLELLAVN